MAGSGVGLGWVAELPGRETDAVRPGHVDAPRHWSWHPPSSTRTARPGRSCAPRPPAPSAVPAVSAITRPSTAPAPRVPRGDGCSEAMCLSCVSDVILCAHLCSARSARPVTADYRTCIRKCGSHGQHPTFG
ncbi:hypothetical protein DC008_15095 [Streptomyces nigra]|nr:hypothetical protein DC008_15095 [Streptomyces nigra]